jgi:hypothetical protein
MNGKALGLVLSILTWLLIATSPAECGSGAGPSRPSPPVATLAYSPDGKLLAAAGRGEAILIDVASGDVAARLPGQGPKVTALVFSRDGRRLAVASGDAARKGEIRVYTLPPSPADAPSPTVTIVGHADLIYDVAFSPDGKLLATGGYDRLIKLWDAASGAEMRVLKDHSDAIYALAFSPDGRLLASAAADRAVKLWDVATGKRLYTLGEATDWLYALTFSPDGSHVAAGGVDKSIRVWAVTPGEGKLVRSAFAHEKAVLKLAYSADGQTLYSLGEDRVVKAWDAAKLTERKVFPTQPEAVLTLALRPDGKQVAVGRYDGVVALFDTTSGKGQGEPLPAKPKPPQIARLTPNAGVRGRPVRVTVEGKHLADVTEIVVNHPGVVAKIESPGGPHRPLTAELTFPPTTPAGQYQVNFKNSVGTSAPVPFIVDLFPSAPEVEPNDAPSQGGIVPLPHTRAGRVDRAGDVDYVRFEAKPGQEVGVQVLTATVGSKVEPVLELFDPRGELVATSTDGVLGHRCVLAGVYRLGLRDREYRGGEGMHYRLHVGDIPVITGVFPLGLRRGSEADIEVDGVNLGGRPVVRIKAPPDAALGAKLPVTVMTPVGPALGSRTVVVGEFTEVLPVASPSPDPGPIPVPGTANGRLPPGGGTDTWRFSAKKGQPLVIEVQARRLGSPLDPYIEILDAKGQPVPRATLRCVARTFLTFRDHDSAGANLRVENWSELAINDFIYLGGELIRVREMPTHPDADMVFFSRGGQRLGYLDTTPTHHAMNEPMYKVEIHPPGATFPPNGFPVFTIPYRNDDGGPGYGKDSRLTFDPPADGEYQVRVGDARGGPAAGAENTRWAYRLTVRPPRPDFQISFNPTAPAPWKGGAAAVSVSIERIDGFEGPVAVRLENLPPGFAAPATAIPAGETSTAFALAAEANAPPPGDGPPLKLVASAEINGRTVRKEATGGRPKLAEPGDITAATVQSEVTVRPGGETRLTVRIERRNGFKGRVPIEVRGLPHGVKVQDIGLNGILITEKEIERTMRIYAEPWVRPQDHPIVVLAKQEGKGAEFAARSVLLRIAGP